MAVNLSWYPDDTNIVLLVFEEEWTADEFVTVANDISRFFDEATGKADVIADVHNVGEFTGLIGHFPKLVQSPLFTHPNSGNHVLVGVRGFVETLANTFGKFSGFNDRLHLAESRDEALALIRRMRAGG